MAPGGVCESGFFADAGLNPGPLPFREPARLLWSVGKEEENNESHEHGRNSLEKEQPLPAVEAEKAVESEERARNRRAYHAGDDPAYGKERDGAGALSGRIPVGEVEDDPGEKSR